MSYVPPHKRQQQNAGGTGAAADQTCQPCAGGTNDGAAAASIEMQPDIGQPVAAQPAAPGRCQARRDWDPRNRNKLCGDVTDRKVTLLDGQYEGYCLSCALYLARQAGNARDFRREVVDRMGEMDHDELAQLVAENPWAIKLCQSVRVLWPVYRAATGMNP